MKKFPNQKPWINNQAHHMLSALSLAFRTGNETEYKDMKYGLEQVKSQYREKLNVFYSTAGSGRMWQGLQHVTDNRTTTSTISSTDSLADDLNTFYTERRLSPLVESWSLIILDSPFDI